MGNRLNPAVHLSIAMLLVVAGCASTTSTAPAGAAGGAGAGTAAATHPGAAAPSPSTPAASCGSVTHMTVDPAIAPPPLCLHTGQALRLTTPSSPRQPWQPFTSAQPAVLACYPQPASQGAAASVCRALHPGHSTVSTANAAFSGDPHGPAQREWQTTVTVAP